MGQCGVSLKNLPGQHGTHNGLDLTSLLPSPPWCSTMPPWNSLHLCFSVRPLDFSSTLSSTRDEYLYCPIKVMQGLRCSSLTAHLVCTGLSVKSSPPTARWMLLKATSEGFRCHLRHLLSPLFYLSALHCVTCCCL